MTAARETVSTIASGRRVLDENPPVRQAVTDLVAALEALSPEDRAAASRYIATVYAGTGAL